MSVKHEAKPTDLDVFFQADACYRRIRSCWDETGLNIPLDVLHQHVRARNPSPRDCDCYIPSFELPADAGGDRYTKAATRRQVAELEKALAYYFSVKAVEPKPKANLIAAVHGRCQAFCELRGAEAQAAKKRRADCKRGGKTRQERLRPARDHAFRLYGSMRPAQGWKNLRAAARHITPHVQLFVKQHGLSVFAGNDPARTVYLWLQAKKDVDETPVI